MYRKALSFACIVILTHGVLALADEPAKDAASPTDCTNLSQDLTKANADLDDCKKKNPNDVSTSCKDQTSTVATKTTALKACQDTIKGSTVATQLDIDAIQKQLDKESKSDFEADLGIGSLIRNGRVTDYSDNSNVLAASSLGYATPQYLIGIAMKAPYQNFGRLHHSPSDACQSAERIKLGTDVTGDKAKAADCPDWKQRPWAGFVSLKFSPNTTQTINGYVIGGSYRAMHYLNALVGFSLTPVNVPSHGLRVTASQYVAAQQKLGNLMNYDPVAMLNNSPDAFDGFSLTDTNGKLIYSGTPLEVDYRGGVVIGISIPIDFSNFLKGK